MCSNKPVMETKAKTQKDIFSALLERLSSFKAVTPRHTTVYSNDAFITAKKVHLTCLTRQLIPAKTHQCKKIPW